MAFSQSGQNMLKIFSVLTFLLLASFTANAEDSDSVKLFIVHFETGLNWDESLPPLEQEQFKEHSKNLNQLRRDKVIAFGARYSEFGVIIVKAKSLAATKIMMEDDPGVKSGIFNFTIEPLNVFYPWES